MCIRDSTTPVTGKTTTKEIVEKMLGRKFEENFPKEACRIGEVLFRTEDVYKRQGLSCGPELTE